MLMRRRDLAAVLLAPEAPADAEIWDAHCHFRYAEGRTPEECTANLIRYGSRHGIRRFTLHLGFDRTQLQNPDPANLRRHNDEVMQAVRAFPDRVFGFVFLNPLRRDASLEELNRCVRDGPLVGVKLVLSTRCNSTLLDPIVERSTALRAVILQHTWLKTGGNLPGESTPQDLAELAARHPRARFIAAHAGGNWEIGIPALKGVRNVAIDTSGIDPTAGFLETAVRELGPERVVYGSDAAVRSFASQLGKVMGADLSAATRGLVLCGNFKRLLKPILDAKGLRA